MKKGLKVTFMKLWRKYFAGAGLPVTYYYSDTAAEQDLQDSKNEGRCLICNLNRVREGHPYIYSSGTPGCSGGKRFTGFTQKLHPDFEYFLSCGIDGKMEGERYKKSPALVKDFLVNHPPFKAPGRYLIFKRWDMLSESEYPLAVIFFAEPDVLSGLYTLANFDSAVPDAVIAPMGSGCSSIISYPLSQSASNNPRCVLGMFDVSARQCVPDNTLTFTVLMGRFEAMVENMEDSFLITGSWRAVKNRIKRL